MANMFSGNKEREIPKSLLDCTRTNKTVDNLHSSAESWESFGKVFGVIIAIVGLIVACFTVANTDEGEGESAAVFIVTMGQWLLYASLTYLVSHAVALLISALASITQNTMISANVALLQASKDATKETIQSTQKKTPQKPPVKVETTQDKIEKDLAKNSSGSISDFVKSIKEMSTEDLKLILEDQKDLYSEDEQDIIKAVLDSRSDGTWVCNKCGKHNENPFGFYCVDCGEGRRN